MLPLEHPLNSAGIHVVSKDNTCTDKHTLAKPGEIKCKHRRINT